MKQTALKRKPMRRAQPKRDWKFARKKVEEEGTCRINNECSPKLDAAHVLGRVHDEKQALRMGFASRAPDGYPLTTMAFVVAPDRIVPLCRRHHQAFDAHELDLAPYLDKWEQAQAVLDAGSIELARNRITGARRDG